MTVQQCCGRHTPLMERTEGHHQGRHFRSERMTKQQGQWPTFVQLLRCRASCKEVASGLDGRLMVAGSCHHLFQCCCSPVPCVLETSIQRTFGFINNCQSVAFCYAKSSLCFAKVPYRSCAGCWPASFWRTHCSLHQQACLAICDGFFMAVARVRKAATPCTAACHVSLSCPDNIIHRRLDSHPLSA